MFKMTINQADGILMLSYSGYFTIYDAKLFQRELELKLKSIRPEDYILVIDMQEVRMASQAVAPMLDEIKKTYMDAPFHYIFTVEADGWLTSRVKRREAERSNMAPVETVDEALLRARSVPSVEKKDVGHTL